MAGVQSPPMTLALFGFLALTTTPAPAQTAYSYRAADGIDHYVGSEDDIPEAYRKVARRIELSGVPLNSDLAKSWHGNAVPPPAEAAGKPSDIELRAPPPPKAETDGDGPNPTTYAVIAAILLCLFPALLLGWLRAPRQRVPMLALALADLALGLGIGLYAARQLRPTNASDLVDLNPLHALDNARSMRDRVNAKEAAQEKQTQEMLGEKGAPKPKAPAQPIKQP
jgi:hypothetical protein